MNDRVDLDLDTLIRSPKRVKLNGEIIEVYPPEVFDFLQLQKTVAKWQNLQDPDSEGAQAYISELEEIIYRLVPAIKGKRISIEQLFALIGLVAEEAKPAEAKELESRNISVSVDEKKMDSNSLENSVDSSTITPAIPQPQL